MQSIRNPDPSRDAGRPSIQPDDRFPCRPARPQLGDARPGLFLSPACGRGPGESGAAALVQVRAASFIVIATWITRSGPARVMPLAARRREYAFTLQNPVSITRMDHDGRMVDSIQAIRLPPNYLPRMRWSPGFSRLCLLRPAPDQFVESPGELSESDAFPQSSMSAGHITFITTRTTSLPCGGTRTFHRRPGRSNSPRPSGRAITTRPHSATT